MTSPVGIDDVDKVLRRPGYLPRFGWHDDHRDRDGTPGYLPALQQVRAEFSGLLDVLAATPGVLGGRCLQLGIGECDASHEVWRVLFARVVTIDWAMFADQGVRTKPGADTHAPATVGFAAARGPYDFLFIDAGHDFEDVHQDYRAYGPLVRKGGIIAFHDSLPRKGYEEVEVWRFLADLAKTGVDVHQIGTEVGVAWVRA